MMAFKNRQNVFDAHCLQVSYIKAYHISVAYPWLIFAY